MVDVTRRLAEAVAPGGHLLIVGHAPPPDTLVPATDTRRKAMFVAEQLLPGVPADFQALVVEQRPRTVTRNAKTFVIHDSTLLARRQVETTRKAQDVRRT